ncbi:MAG: quinolinate synthase NadA [Candidatus Marinimicrobia bacterium]|nr:quinolinate synthase NadA [Candidatus Neomarinimicrobiota bacterium]
MYIEDQTIAPGLDLFEEIERLKAERNAVILAHYYQDPDIQDIADHLGDSLKLAQLAAQTDADVILFCGVLFMAETAKILNPDRIVLVPDLEAGCSLADSCPPDLFKEYIDRYPDHAVITYINTTAEVKALTDIICTSSNAVRVIASIPEDQPIIFAPDRHLGNYLVKQTGREMKIWNGTCMVHEIFSEQEILRLKAEHPEAVLLAHPECDETILRHADFIGSTTAIIAYTASHDETEYIVATEEGVVHQMKKASPEKTFIPAPTTTGCACNQCPHMRRNTLEKIFLALRDLKPEITMDEGLRLRALRPLERMLALG